jgi:hypothetical protein
MNYDRSMLNAGLFAEQPLNSNQLSMHAQMREGALHARFESGGAISGLPLCRNYSAFSSKR